MQISLLIQTRTLFHWRKSYYGLWTLCIWVKNILMLDLFHLLSSPDVNWWTGVVWIIVMFLSALILTAPIHCRASECVCFQSGVSEIMMSITQKMLSMELLATLVCFYWPWIFFCIFPPVSLFHVEWIFRAAVIDLCGSLRAF